MRGANCGVNLNAGPAQLAYCIRKQIEWSLAEAELMACGLLIILIITRMSLRILPPIPPGNSKQTSIPESGSFDTFLFRFLI